MDRAIIEAFEHVAKNLNVDLNSSEKKGLLFDKNKITLKNENDQSTISFKENRAVNAYTVTVKNELTFIKTFQEQLKSPEDIFIKKNNFFSKLLGGSALKIKPTKNSYLPKLDNYSELFQFFKKYPYAEISIKKGNISISIKDISSATSSQLLEIHSFLAKLQRYLF